jgi:hypothetical protein
MSSFNKIIFGQKYDFTFSTAGLFELACNSSIIALFKKIMILVFII